jgi:putative DNA primase/helicase
LKKYASMKTNITPDLIRAALQFISANLPRNEWARVGMAIKSEFPDSTGLDLFMEWSASADAYDIKATRSTWRSIKAGGGVGIGTLLHLAKENGFALPKADQAASKPDSETTARLARERVASQQAAQAQQQAAHAHAAGEAVALWAQASETGESPYLTRKGVQPHGLRFADDGWLLVPLRDDAGQLCNVQRIAPSKPAGDGPDKLFLKGGRKAGLWHLFGDVGSDAAGPAVLLLAEGYATAASLHEATGRPVAVAFDAGNLAQVAKALRKLYPPALLVLCGDDDVQTFARTGNNPGRDKATAAARSVRGLAVFPESLPEGGSDFNDMHQVAGLEAVRCVVDAAIDAHQATARAAQSSKAGKAFFASEAAGEKGCAVDAFAVNDIGVWHQGFDRDGKQKQLEWVCSRLDVEARTRNRDDGDWGYLLTFADPLGNAKQWAMPSRMLSGDGGEYRATLLYLGLRIHTTPRARNLLTQYIQSRAPDEFATCTDTIGWDSSSRAFVLPRETIGNPPERVIFQSDKAIENTFTRKGAPEQWRDRVGALCVGNSRLVFSASTAFAGPLLKPAGMESGGFHFVGDSSCGKTTCLNVAASVWGGKNFKRTWQGTGVGFEVVAGASCDTVLLLDELKECDPKIAAQVVYMLGNQQGKMRGNTGVQMRPMTRWNLLFLSTGEITLEQHLASIAAKINEGQKTRLVNIPVDPGMELGAFEELHGHVGGAEFSKHITQEAQAVYGATGRAWLEWLTTHADTLKASIRKAADALAAQLIPKDAGGQVERVGARFALVGAAGELATTAGLTGWASGESEQAARACFNAWLAARGGNGNGEVVAMLRAVRRFLETHGEGRFTWWHRGADDHSVKTLQRAGFRRLLDVDGNPIKTNSQHGSEYGDRMPAAMGEGVSVEYFILAETFRSEVCQGFDYQAVCRVLIERGCLVHDKDRFDCRPRLPGLAVATCYRITPAIFGLDLF